MKKESMELRLTVEQKESYQRAAGECGKKLSDWARCVLDDAAGLVEAEEEVKEQLREVTKVPPPKSVDPEPMRRSAFPTIVSTSPVPSRYLPPPGKKLCARCARVVRVMGKAPVAGCAECLALETVEG